jgi:hypothetical protein
VRDISVVIETELQAGRLTTAHQWSCQGETRGRSVKLTTPIEINTDVRKAWSFTIIPPIRLDSVVYIEAQKRN